MEDDDDIQAKGGKTQEVANTGPAMGPVYLMWENTLEKLKILNYEQNFCGNGKHQPFSRIHFVVPAKNQSSQFDDFIDVCSWLCAVITKNTETFRRDQYDDPNTITNKLLLALRQLDFKGSFPSQKLRTPHGESACMVMEFLVDKALENKGFKFANPVYLDIAETAQNPSDDADADDVEDEGIVEEDDDPMFQDINRDDDGVDGAIDEAAHQILQAAIDPIEWKTELERVGPKLRAQQQLSTHEWRAHVDQTLSSKEHIDKIMNEAQGDLSTMNRVVGDEITRTRTKERYISHQFAALCTEYQEIKKRMEELDGLNKATNERVTKLTNDLSEINDKLEELKESFESKDSGINDTSPLVRVKAALQNIKSEINAFDLRLGVVSHSLLQVRVTVANRKRLHNAQKNRKRRAAVGNRSRRNKSSDVADDDDSVVSED